MKLPTISIALIIITVMALIQLSVQDKRCSCHQCNHIRSEGRRCECCVYMLHGKKRSPEVPTPLVMDNYFNKEEEDDYVNTDIIEDKTYSRFSDDEDRGTKRENRHFGIVTKETFSPFYHEMLTDEKIFMSYLEKANQLVSARISLEDK